MLRILVLILLNLSVEGATTIKGATTIPTTTTTTTRTTLPYSPGSITTYGLQGFNQQYPGLQIAMYDPSQSSVMFLTSVCPQYPNAMLVIFIQGLHTSVISGISYTFGTSQKAYLTGNNGYEFPQSCFLTAYNVLQTYDTSNPGGNQYMLFGTTAKVFTFNGGANPVYTLPLISPQTSYLFTTTLTCFHNLGLFPNPGCPVLPQEIMIPPTNNVVYFSTPRVTQLSGVSRTFFDCACLDTNTTMVTVIRFELGTSIKTLIGYSTGSFSGFYPLRNVNGTVNTMEYVNPSNPQLLNYVLYHADDMYNTQYYSSPLTVSYPVLSMFPLPNGYTDTSIPAFSQATKKSCLKGYENFLRPSDNLGCFGSYTYAVNTTVVPPQTSNPFILPIPAISIPLQSYVKNSGTKCNPGYAASYNSNQCMPCPINTYWTSVIPSLGPDYVYFDGSIASQCVPCPDGSTTASVGATSMNQCTISTYGPPESPFFTPTSILIPGTYLRTGPLSTSNTIPKNLNISTEACLEITQDLSTVRVYVKGLSPVYTILTYNRSITNTYYAESIGLIVPGVDSLMIQTGVYSKEPSSCYNILTTINPPGTPLFISMNHALGESIVYSTALYTLQAAGTTPVQCTIIDTINMVGQSIFSLTQGFTTCGVVANITFTQSNNVAIMSPYPEYTAAVSGCRVIALSVSNTQCNGFTSQLCAAISSAYTGNTNTYFSRDIGASPIGTLGVTILTGTRHSWLSWSARSTALTNTDCTPTISSMLNVSDYAFLLMNDSSSTSPTSAPTCTCASINSTNALNIKSNTAHIRPGGLILLIFLVLTL